MTSAKCKIQIENYALNIIWGMMGARQRGIGQIVSRAFNDLKSHLEHHPDWRRVRDDMGLMTAAEWEAVHAAKSQAEREAAQAAEHQAKVDARTALYLVKEAAKNERAVKLAEARQRYADTALALHKDLGVLQRIQLELDFRFNVDHRFRYVPLPATWVNGLDTAKLILQNADAIAKSRSSTIGLVDHAYNQVTAVRADVCKYVEALYATGMPDMPNEFPDIWDALRDNRWSGGSRPRDPLDDNSTP